jgi:hypothetical protein
MISADVRNGDGNGIGAGRNGESEDETGDSSDGSSSEGEATKSDTDDAMSNLAKPSPPILDLVPVSSPPLLPQQLSSTLQTTGSSHLPSNDTDLTHEKVFSLSLLQ